MSVRDYPSQHEHLRLENLEREKRLWRHKGGGVDNIIMDVK
jgi:hypothetical protein